MITCSKLDLCTSQGVRAPVGFSEWLPMAFSEALNEGRSVAILMFQKVGGNGSPCFVKKMPDDALGESLRVGGGRFLVPVAGAAS